MDKKNNTPDDVAIYEDIDWINGVKMPVESEGEREARLKMEKMERRKEQLASFRAFVWKWFWKVVWVTVSGAILYFVNKLLSVYVK